MIPDIENLYTILEYQGVAHKKPKSERVLDNIDKKTKEKSK